MRKYLLLLISLLLISCSDYRFEITKDTEVTLIGRANTTIGIQLDLYGHTLLIDIINLKIAEMAYFSKMDKIPITIVVKVDDSDLMPSNIYLYHKNEVFGSSKGYPIEISLLNELMRKDLDIPNFVWYVYNGDHYDDGLTPQELRVKLKKDGGEPPETKVITTVEEKKGEDKSL